MLTAIRKTLASIGGEFAGNANDALARIPKEDPKVYEALCRADSVGVFQVESRAQMSMLPRLRPKEFYDLVIQVAIVRPGPIQGGMVHPYLRRRSGKEDHDFPHPSFEPVLSRTFGVPLFQEQVMQLAIIGAGYTGAEADQLRRDMAAWRRNGRLERHKQKLKNGFRAKGIKEEFIDQLYKQIQGFGEYGFPESHAASFALLVYASAWLHLHYPAEFAVAIVNSQPMGFYQPGTLFEDARRHGVEVRPADITRSDWDCTLEDEGAKGPAVRVGLRLVRGLGEPTVRRIEAARHERPFATLEDLTARARLERRDVEALAEAGALEPLVPGRREASWAAHAPRSEGLFDGRYQDGPPVQLPLLGRFETVALDFERTGFTVREHPMQILRAQLPPSTKSTRELAALDHGVEVSVAGMVISRQRPGTASGVVFMTLEDEFGFANLIFYARVFDRLRHVATGYPLLTVHGHLEREGAVVHVIVDKVEPLHDVDIDPVSRDFH
jgi:error-prone DNA polymerase